MPEWQREALVLLTLVITGAFVGIWLATGALFWLLDKALDDD